MFHGVKSDPEKCPKTKCLSKYTFFLLSFISEKKWKKFLRKLNKKRGGKDKHLVFQFSFITNLLLKVLVLKGHFKINTLKKLTKCLSFWIFRGQNEGKNRVKIGQKRPKYIQIQSFFVSGSLQKSSFLEQKSSKR